MRLTTTRPQVTEPYEGPSAPAASVVYTLSDVRTVLAKLSHDGHTAEVQALIRKFGGKRLSDIPAEKYSDLMKEAEALSDAA